MKDYIIRATAADNQIRAFVSSTAQLVEKARQLHETSPVATAALGRTLTAAGIMGSMMKGADDVLTIQFKGDGPLEGITVTADSKARVKGYVNNPQVMLPISSAGKLDVGGAVGLGELVVIKDLGLKEPYVGRTQLVSGEIAEDLTYYFADSEQVPSAVALGVLLTTENVIECSGGFILQLMPSASEEVISALERKMSDVEPVTAMLSRGMTPEDILQELLGDMGVEINDKIETSFYCSCDKPRVEKALLSMGEREMRTIIAEGEDIEVACHFCNSKYKFTVAELTALLNAGLVKG